MRGFHGSSCRLITPVANLTIPHLEISAEMTRCGVATRLSSDTRASNAVPGSWRAAWTTAGSTYSGSPEVFEGGARAMLQKHRVSRPAMSCGYSGRHFSSVEMHSLGWISRLHLRSCALGCGSLIDVEKGFQRMAMREPDTCSQRVLRRPP